MIQLLTLLCSLCINFVAVDITPFDYSTYEYISTNDLTTVTNLYGWDVSTDYIASYHQGNYPFVVVPYKHFVSSADDWGATYTYFVDDNNQVIGFRVVYSNVRVLSRGARGGQEYFDYIGNNKITYDCYFQPYNQTHSGSRRIDSLNTDYLPYVVNDIAFVVNGFSSDDGPGFSSSFLGSLTHNGHSISQTGIESLDNFSWSSIGQTFTPSGVSHDNLPTITFNFADAGQNLLAQIINNTNGIISNTHNIGETIKELANNMIKGFSAVFNGISTFNDNVVGFFNYLIEVPSSSDIVDALQSEENIGALYDLSQQFNIFSDIGLTQVNSAPTYTFNFSGTMFDYVNNVTLDFSFLDSTKSIWQTFLIALLYFNLLVTILVGLPDLIQGRGET